MIRCSACGASLPPDSRFCGECGASAEAPAPSRCRSCGADLPPDARFCTECGSTASPNLPPTAPMQAAPQAPPLAPVPAQSVWTPPAAPAWAPPPEPVPTAPAAPAWTPPPASAPAPPSRPPAWRRRLAIGAAVVLGIPAIYAMGVAALAPVTAGTPAQPPSPVAATPAAPAGAAATAQPTAAKPAAPTAAAQVVDRPTVAPSPAAPASPTARAAATPTAVARPTTTTARVLDFSQRPEGYAGDSGLQRLAYVDNELEVEFRESSARYLAVRVEDWQDRFRVEIGGRDLSAPSSATLFGVVLRLSPDPEKNALRILLHPGFIFSATSTREAEGEVVLVQPSRYQAPYYTDKPNLLAVRVDGTRVGVQLNGVALTTFQVPAPLKVLHAGAYASSALPVERRADELGRVRFAHVRAEPQ